ncbi:hypothetical protein ABPG74_001027 [Tetrahymena malaccensis]
MENLQNKKKFLDDKQLQEIYNQSQDCSISTNQILQANNYLFQRDYDVLDIIASSKYSVVFKAFSNTLNTEVAIKIQICRNQAVLKELQKQFIMFQNYEDKNLLKIHQIYHDDLTEMLFVVMDLCINGDLYHFVRRDQKLSLQNTYDFCAQAIRSLLVLHQKNVIHGDLNPSNLLIDSSYTLKFSYQGASKFLYNSLKHAFYDPFTVYYSSREQLDEQNQTAESDLYSLGVVLLDIIGLRVESKIEQLLSLQSRNIDQLLLLKNNIEGRYHFLFEIALDLIKNDRQILRTDQSVEILEQSYKQIKCIIEDCSFETNQSQFNQDQQHKLNKIDEIKNNNQRISTKNQSFLYFLFTNTKLMFLCVQKSLRKAMSYLIYLIVLILESIRKQNKLKINPKEDKSVQTQSSDDSQNCTPAYRKSKFYDNKFNQWNSTNSDSQNQPIEYEITTQYFDTEDENQESSKQNELGNNKIDLNNLPSSESDISLDEINENLLKKDQKQQKVQESQFEQKSIVKQLTTNATSTYSQSDNLIEEKNGQQRNRKASQQLESQSKQQQQQSSQQDIVFFPNGYYIGEVQQKVPHGQGKMYFHKGNRYEGSFIDGLYEGKGVYYYLGGNKYTGQWKNNLREGHGMYRWANGTVYIGEYFQNAKNGKGTLKFHNGERYEGQFKDNNFDGKGTYYFTDGVRFEGEFDNGKALNGQFYLANGLKSDNQNFRKIPDHKKHINTQQ